MFCSLAMNSTWNACGSVFHGLFSRILIKFTEHWNSHDIRKSRYSTVSGVPNILYMLPEYNGKQDCLVPSENQDIEEMKAHCELEDQRNTMYTEYIYIYICVCVCVYVYIYIYIYICHLGQSWRRHAVFFGWPCLHVRARSARLTSRVSRLRFHFVSSGWCKCF